MAAPVLLHHVVGDLTLGKPDLVEFYDTETLEAAIKAISEQNEGAIAVWRNRGAQTPSIPGEDPKVTSFVGMLNSLDVVAFIARVGNHETALRSPVSEVVTPNSSLLKEVDPGTRLLDALEMMKQGVRRLLVRKTVAWKGMSKRFSVVFNGRWMKSYESTVVAPAGTSSRPTSPSSSSFCCLSREDVVRFLISCLGALAPLPLTSITALGAVSPHYCHVEASSPALEVAGKVPEDPCAIAVVETADDGAQKIIGEISAYKLWKCDYPAASWAMASFSAGQFVTGFEEEGVATPPGMAGFSVAAAAEERILGAAAPGRGIEPGGGRGLGMYRGRSSPLMCRRTSSLAAVMAQMLSHRATHVWVTEPAGGGGGGGGGSGTAADDVLVGVVSYTDILHAVTRNTAGGAAAPPLCFGV
ncbi:unnamed protein product [Spirodela intermedia]|uniref:CBS domain-containing protein n=1 Tax=Spirodela intermedia TaxID=51605 RepID=A0A7I8JCJ4_SPIIN|nr:unnamed protein product [Spirodela intermedia]CAA6667896.1 unnamed protein product [Spirodela intermedia]